MRVLTVVLCSMLLAACGSSGDSADVDTGATKVRRFYALDDCGTRINPMIIEGQIHGGLTEGFAVAMGQEMPYDEAGNLLGATLLDYFVPTSAETPKSCWRSSTPFPIRAPARPSCARSGRGWIGEAR